MKSSFTLMYQNPVTMIQIKSQIDEEKAVKIVFVDLEWPREVKRNVDTDLSEPYQVGGGGQEGGRPGEKGAGGVREAGEEGAGSGIPKVAGSGRKREKLCNIAQYFAIEKMQRGGSQKIQGGNRD